MSEKRTLGCLTAKFLTVSILLLAAVIYCAAVLVPLKIPVANEELSYARILSLMAEESPDTAFKKAAERASICATENLGLAVAVKRSKTGDFEAAEKAYSKLLPGINRDAAAAYIGAYKTLAKKPGADAYYFFSSPYNRSLTNALIYAETKDKRRFDAAIAFAKKAGVAECRNLSRILTPEFEGKSMYLENLKFWEEVSPAKFDIDSADASKIYSDKNSPKWAKKRVIYSRAIFFRPIFNAFKSGNITREQALKLAESELQKWLVNGRYLLIFIMDEIAIFLHKIGETDKAAQFLETMLADNTKGTGMGLQFYKFLKVSKAARAYEAMGMHDKAVEAVFTHGNFMRRIEAFSNLAEGVSESNPARAARLSEYGNSVVGRLKILYGIPFDEKQ